MNVEMALRSAMVAFSQVHVLATDAKAMGQGMDMLLGAIKTLEAVRKEAEEHEHHDGQGEKV